MSLSSSNMLRRLKYHPVASPSGSSSSAVSSNPCRSSFNRYFSSKGVAHQRECRPIKKLLIANRGEIAVRIHRAAKEKNIETIGVYAKEDNQALHRTVVDKASLIGAGRTPVGAYLHYPEIIDVAKQSGADAIHPGYGFLSENSEFAAAVEAAGIMLVGPPPEVIRLMGDKVEARKTAIAAGIPVIPGTEVPLTDVDEAMAVIKEIGCPVMLKAAFGGGGRGMRQVWDIKDARTAFERASSEAMSAFGNGAMFVEKLVTGGRHIEVQILGDHHGDVIHLRERDCSVQRRHQKVIEIAPAPFLPEAVRTAILEDALKLANSTGYQNAGTVEFLVDKNDQHFFIEVNARLQVEHTVTEEVTGVDIVKSQLAIREGQSLRDLGLTQDAIHLKGCSIQCRITTEDSQRDFMPSTGRVDLYAPATGRGIRLDAALAASGAVITPHFDSLLVKLIATAESWDEAVHRITRAMKETRIRGVTTNIPFILNVLQHGDFRQGKTTVAYLDEHPELRNYDPLDLTSANLCRYLAEVVVNGPQTDLVNPRLTPDRKRVPLPPLKFATHESPKIPTGGGSWAGAPVPETDDSSTSRVFAPRGYKGILDEVGPEEFAKLIRSESRLLITDTTMRDAHQSLFATRMRTHDLLRAAPATAQYLPQLFSLENWGGATFDVCYRFLKESPWHRLEQLRSLVPNIPFQMLLRGANAVGYTAYPDNAVEKFCDEAVRHGMDIFRVFDSLNYIENMKLGIQAVGAAGGVVEAAISYTGDVADPQRQPYTLDYYLDFAHQLVKENIHILCVKDMAGLLTPSSATKLIGGLRAEFPNLPIHVHTHDTGGMGVASMLAAAHAGADVVDAALDSMSGLTSQPSFGAIVAGLQHTPLDTGISLTDISPLSDYWEGVRRAYAPFDCTSTLKSTSSDVYIHEIPGGQFTNLHMQAWALGIADKWPAIKAAYAEANKCLGDIIKVTPSSKVVGDLAQFMVQNNLHSAEEVNDKAETLSFPQSVVEYFQGLIGQPPFGFPEKLRKAVLGEKMTSTDSRPGEDLPPIDWGDVRQRLDEKHGRRFSEADLVSSVMYPKVFDEYQEFRKTFGDVSVLPTPQYFTGPEPGEEMVIHMAGREVTIKYIAKTALLNDGTRDVYFEVMGLPRSINVLDKSAKSAEKGTANIKADMNDMKQLGAPMPGTILAYKVKEGQKIKKGDPIVVLAAMKMETVVVSPVAGEIASIPLRDGNTVAGGDLVVRFR